MFAAESTRWWSPSTRRAKLRPSSPSRRQNPMPIGGMIKKVFGTSHEREIKRLRPRVERINALEPAWQKLTDAELRGKTAEFKQKLDNGAKLDDILEEAFATLREAG